MGTPALAAMSFRAALNIALKFKNTEDWPSLTAAPLNAGVAKEVFDQTSSAFTCSASSGIDILDLLGLPLSSEQIHTVVAEFPNLDALDLSGNRLISAKALSNIRCTYSCTLRRLVLINAPGMDEDDESKQTKKYLYMPLTQKILSRSQESAKYVKEDIRKTSLLRALAATPEWEPDW
ncbi:hypothetical protein FRB97_006407 [Tulasnella sp. 331]|nr:hypothetical protein FRB97_006407 [Tulasnella sp. 331]